MPRFLLRACLLLASAPFAVAEGGFISLQSGITDSQDMDRFGTPIQLHFGPNITDQLSLEFGLMDMGEASYDDPKADFSEADRDTAPSFSNLSQGEVSSQSANDDRPASATYTGLSSIRPQGFLVMLRYRFRLLDDVDVFVKTGANIWAGDYEEIEITAQVNDDGSHSVVKQRGSKGSASAVDQITGGGVIWHLSHGLAARAELITTALDSQDFERVRFQLMTLGVHYEF